MITAEQYLAELQALLPPGAAWPREADATLTLTLLALADELARIDARAEVLLDEADPRTTLELLADWERVAGLPDPCVVVEQSTAQRRTGLVSRLTARGGQSRQFYIDLASALGYVITITEFNPHDVDDDVDEPLYGNDWQFAWQVNAPGTQLGEFTVDETVDDGLGWFGNERLECVLKRSKPAHTSVLFEYT